MNKELYIDTSTCFRSGMSLREGISSLLWLGLATGIYLMSLVLVRHNPQWSPTAKTAVELATLLPGALYLSSLLHSLKKMDELQRRIRFEALLFAFAGTVCLSTMLSVLNANGVGFVNYPHGLEIGGTYLSVFILSSIGVAILARRYR